MFFNINNNLYYRVRYNLFQIIQNGCSLYVDMKNILKIILQTQIIYITNTHSNVVYNIVNHIVPQYLSSTFCSKIPKDYRHLP